MRRTVPPAPLPRTRPSLPYFLERWAWVASRRDGGVGEGEAREADFGGEWEIGMEKEEREEVLSLYGVLSLLCLMSLGTQEGRRERLGGTHRDGAGSKGSGWGWGWGMWWWRKRLRSWRGPVFGMSGNVVSSDTRVTLRRERSSCTNMTKQWYDHFPRPYPTSSASRFRFISRETRCCAASCLASSRETLETGLFEISARQQLAI